MAATAFRVAVLPAALRPARVEVAPRGSSSSCSVGVAVCGVKQVDLMADIRQMSTPQIEEAVVDLKGELFLLRCQKVRAPQEYKPSQAQDMRKKIARMMTVKREREIEEGVSKRESRKLDYKWRKSIVPRPPPSYNPADYQD